MAQFFSFAILLGKLKHKNNNINFLAAKTCTTIKHSNPAAPSISYVINPDGSEGLAPFVVSCNITDKKRVGVTVVSHASTNRMLVDCYEPAGCYLRNISYLSGSIWQADLATGRERQLTTGKRAERTKHDFRRPICRSAIG